MLCDFVVSLFFSYLFQSILFVLYEVLCRALLGLLLPVPSQILKASLVLLPVFRHPIVHWLSFSLQLRSAFVNWGPSGRRSGTQYQIDQNSIFRASQNLSIILIWQTVNSSHIDWSSWHAIIACLFLCSRTGVKLFGIKLVWNSLPGVFPLLACDWLVEIVFDYSLAPLFSLVCDLLIQFECHHPFCLSLSAYNFLVDNVLSIPCISFSLRVTHRSIDLVCDWFLHSFFPCIFFITLCAIIPGVMMAMTHSCFAQFMKFRDVKEGTPQWSVEIIIGCALSCGCSILFVMVMKAEPGYVAQGKNAQKQKGQVLNSSNTSMNLHMVYTYIHAYSPDYLPIYLPTCMYAYLPTCLPTCLPT